MKTTCPKCGELITVSGLGRKPFNKPVINVCDTLRLYSSVLAAANELGCSRAYIYKVLKANGLKVQEVMDKRFDIQTISRI